MFERLSQDAMKVMILAQSEAKRLEHGWCGAEHIVLGLIGERASIASQELKNAGVTLKAAQISVCADNANDVAPKISWFGKIFREKPYKDEVKDVIEQSWKEAELLGSREVNANHLLLALLRMKQARVVKALEQADLAALRLAVEARLANGNGKP